MHIKYWSNNTLISILNFYSLHAAAGELVHTINLTQSKRGEDALNICLLCHASRQGASLSVVHPLIYQMSTVGLVQFYKEQSWLSSWAPRKAYLRKSDTTKSEKQLFYIYIHPSDLVLGNACTVDICTYPISLMNTENLSLRSVDFLMHKMSLSYSHACTLQQCLKFCIKDLCFPSFR